MSGTISDISWSLHLGNLQSSSQDDYFRKKQFGFRMEK